MEKFRNLFTCGLLKLQEYNYFPGNIYPLTHKELPLFQRQRHHHNSFVGSEAEMYGLNSCIRFLFQHGFVE